MVKNSLTVIIKKKEKRLNELKKTTSIELLKEKILTKMLIKKENLQPSKTFE